MMKPHPQIITPSHNKTTPTNHHTKPHPPIYHTALHNDDESTVTDLHTDN